MKKASSNNSNRADSSPNNVPQTESLPKHPWWETLVLVVSFLLLWIWMLGRFSARLPVNAPIGPAWTAIQIAALVALVWVFARRMKRVKEALRQTMEKDFGFSQRRK